jgi:hypothetical protein
VSGAELPPFAAHLVDGQVIDVINVSRTGILTRSEARLMPGSMIGLRVLTSDDNVVLFGRVVRSRLLSINDEKPHYESALAFSRDFPLLSASAHPDQVAEIDAAASDIARSTGAYASEIGRLHGSPTVLTVTAFAGDCRDAVLRAFDVEE